jgi:hypothetical protein
MKLPRTLTPTHWVYLLAHALLLALGIFVVRSSVSTAWVGIGTSLVAAGITGWTVFLYVFLSEDVSERLRVLVQFGITNIFDARSVRIRGQYDKRLLAAREHIDIMAYGLRALREDYLDSFPRWRDHADVRILLLDPSFPSPNFSFAAQRDTEERQNVGTIEQDVNDFIRDVRPVLNTQGSRKFEVRLYRCLPTMNIFRIDDEVFFGPYLLKGPSRNSPTILLKRGGLLFDRVVSQFETVGSDPNLSIPVP